MITTALYSGIPACHFPCQKAGKNSRFDWEKSKNPNTPLKLYHLNFNENIGDCYRKTLTLSDGRTVVTMHPLDLVMDENNEILGCLVSHGKEKISYLKNDHVSRMVLECKSCMLCK